jgi:hypothetical protein
MFDIGTVHVPLLVSAGKLFSGSSARSKNVLAIEVR